MNKGKKFIAACSVAVGVGIVFCVTGYAMGGRVYGISVGPGGLSVNTPQDGNGRVSYSSGNEALEAFESIDIAIDYANITVKPSDHYGMEYLIDDRSNFTYEVNDGCLNIRGNYKDVYSGMNFTFFGIGTIGRDYKQEYVTVYVPEEELCNMGGTVKIASETGNIDCSNLYADTFTLDADYGNVSLVLVGSANAKLEMETGKLEMEWFEGGDLSIKNDYGNVNLEEINAADIKVVMESGSLDMEAVKGQSLGVFSDYGNISLRDAGFAKDTSFEAESGNIRLKGFTADCIDVKSEYGNVNIEITDALESYTYDLYTEYGDITVGRKDMGNSYRSLEDSSATKEIRVICESGEIAITQK